MIISNEEYLFYEWLILEKNLSVEDLKNMSGLAFSNLKLEYKQFEAQLK